jgi:hypothetical protein
MPSLSRRNQTPRDPNQAKVSAMSEELDTCSSSVFYGWTGLHVRKEWW